MNKSFFLLLLITFTVKVSFAVNPTQTIRGVITDADTRVSIPGANVVILATSPLLGSTSDADGKFVIEHVPAGRYNIKVSFMGYETVIMHEVLVTSGKEVFLNVEMKEAIVTTNEVVIKAQSSKDKPLNTMTSVSARSFSVEESRRYAGSNDDPLRAASAFAGVSANTSTERNDIVVRGNSPKGLLWRLEGVDIPNPNHFARVGSSGGGLTIFSSQVLGNSDFITAAFPAEYGDALAGVFDVRFRNGNNATREYTFQLGLLGIDASAEGPFVKGRQASYLFNYRYSTLALLGKVDREFEKTMPDYQDLSFKINIPTRKAGTFSLLGIGGTDHSGLEPEEDTLKWENFEDREKTKLNTSMGALVLSHVISLSRQTWMKSNLSVTGNGITYEDGFYTGPGKFRPTDRSAYSNSRASFAWNLNTKFGQRLVNKAGFYINHLMYDISIEAEDVFTGQFGTMVDEAGNANAFQVFDQMRFDFSDRLSVNAGVAARHFDVNGMTSIEPRAGIRWEPFAGHAFSLGYGLHSQMENPVIYLARNNGNQINKDLDFARASHYVLGYDYMMNEFMRFKTEVYYQHLYDLPVNPGTSFALINSAESYFNDTLTNAGRGKNYGVEFTLEHFLHHNFYYLFTASLYRSKYTGGDQIERNGRYDGRYVLNALIGKEFAVRGKNLLGVNFKATLSGGEWFIPVDEAASVAANRSVYDYTQAYTRQLPSFVYTDITLTYRCNHEKYSGVWAIQVKNVLNHRPAVGYRYDTYSGTIEEILPMGMVPVISYKVEF